MATTVNHKVSIEKLQQYQKLSIQASSIPRMSKESRSLLQHLHLWENIDPLLGTTNSAPMVVHGTSPLGPWTRKIEETNYSLYGDFVHVQFMIRVSKGPSMGASHKTAAFSNVFGKNIKYQCGPGHQRILLYIIFDDKSRMDGSRIFHLLCVFPAAMQANGYDVSMKIS